MSDVTPTSLDADTVGDTPEVKMDTLPLTLSDRCDRCGAQAFVRAEMIAGDLLFCAHHGRKYNEALVAQAVSIQDESDKINIRPSMSANAL